MTVNLSESIQKPYVSNIEDRYEVLGNKGQVKAAFKYKEHGGRTGAHKKAQEHWKKHYDEYMNEDFEQLDELSATTVDKVTQSMPKNLHQLGTITRIMRKVKERRHAKEVDDKAKKLGDPRIKESVDESGEVLDGVKGKISKDSNEQGRVKKMMGNSTVAAAVASILARREKV